MDRLRPLPRAAPRTTLSRRAPANPVPGEARGVARGRDLSGPVPEWVVPLKLVLSSALILLVCAQAFGPMIVMAEIILVGLLFWSSRTDVLVRPGSTAFILALPGMAVASAAWSIIPDQTLRYGLQLVLTGVIGLVIARAVPPSRFALVLFIGTTVASLLGLASGRTGPSVHGPVLVGLAGSKNQLGYMTLIWLLACLAVMTDGQRSVWLRLAALCCIPVAVFLLAQSEAATATVAATTGVVLYLMLASARWFGRGKRFVLLASALLIGGGLAATGPDLMRWSEQIATDILKKDPTLSGRTALWESADELIAREPLIGHGYRAIWMGPEGRGLLARNLQKDGRSFNFHDTFREVRVDMGVVGLLLLLLPLGYALVKLVLAHVDRPTIARALLLAILILTVLRLKTEVLIIPFLLDTVVLYAVMFHAAALVLGGHRPPSRRVRQRGAPEVRARGRKQDVPAAAAIPESG